MNHDDDKDGPDRLHILLDRYRAGALSEEDRAELERALLSSPQARQAFWEHARFHALLARWGQEEWGRRMAIAPAGPTGGGGGGVADRPRRPARAGWRPWWAAVAAGIALVVVLIVLGRGRRPGVPDGSVAGTDPSPATAPAGIAVLGSAVDAQWGDAAAGRAVGSVLPAGTLRLESGAVQVEFYSGARLVIQGPAEVRLISEMEAFCQSGRLTAYVPAPARGFKVTAPGVVVVDLGTEFGLTVPAAGAPEVHVFTGAVDVRRAAGAAAAVRLAAGEGARVEPGSITPMAASRRGFLDERELARLVGKDSERRKEVWQRAAAALGRDAATLLHFAFDGDPDGGRTLTNRAAGAAGAVGSVVGCGWADGRWAGARAVEFRSAGDRIRIDVPGQFRAVTLLAWVRVDALPNAYHALLAPDGQAPGTLRWGMSRHGELRLGIARESGKPEANWEVVISPPVITPERVGRWMMVAVTFDGKVLRHFVDGQVVKVGEAFSPAPLVIGPAEVGNGRGEWPKFVQGRVDEFAILSRALSIEEVAALYNAGRPAGVGAP